MHQSQVDRDVAEWVNTNSARDVTVTGALRDDLPPRNIAFSIIDGI